MTGENRLKIGQRLTQVLKDSKSNIQHVGISVASNLKQFERPIASQLHVLTCNVCKGLNEYQIDLPISVCIYRPMYI